MIPVTVQELVELVGAEVRSSADAVDAEVLARVVTGLVVDSRQVAPGDLFLALPGEHVDGHDFVAAAFAGGAAAALTARPVSGAPGPCLVVADPLAAAGQVARDQVDRAVAAGALQVAAITGSAGKTSTKDLLAQLVETTGPTVASAGNLNNELGVPLTVCRIDSCTRFLVAEMGARGIGHIAYLCTIAPPRVAAVLNVGTAHLGEFGGRQQIARAKGEIVEALTGDGTAVLNADDPLVWAMRARTPGRVVATSVLAEPTVDDAVWATEIAADALGCCAFTLHEKSAGAARAAHVRLGLSGRHQVANAVTAAAMARALGVDFDAVVRALPDARPRSRWRMELTRRADGVLVVNDAYNANPESMRAALDTVGAMMVGRSAAGVVGWAVLGDMLELGESAADEHRGIGAYAARQGITRLLALGSFADQIVAGARAVDPAVRAEVVCDRDDAVRRVQAGLAPGDVVLVKASRGLALDTVAAALTTVAESDRDGEQEKGSA